MPRAGRGLRMTTRLVLGALVALAVAALPFHRAAAATIQWSGGGTNSLWSNTANWSGGVAPTNNDSVVFPSGVTNKTTTDDISSLTLAGISFGDGGYFINGSNALTVTGGIGSTISSAVSADIIEAPIAINEATLNLNFANVSNEIIFTNTVSEISGPRAVAVSGGGAAFSAANSWTGGTAFDSTAWGVVTNASGLGTGTVTVLNGGFIDFGGGSSYTVANAFSIVGNGGGSGALVDTQSSLQVNFSGQVTLNGNTAVGVTGTSSALFFGAVNQSTTSVLVAFTADLSSAVKFAGTNTWSGGTEVNGQVQAFGSSSLGTGTAMVDSGKQLFTEGTAGTWSQPLVLAGGEVDSLATGGDTIWSGPVLVNGPGTSEIANDSAGIFSLTGSLGGAGDLLLAGTVDPVVVGGTGNGVTGATSVDGAVQFGTASGTATSGAVIVDNGGVLDFTANGQLGGSGDFTVDQGGAVHMSSHAESVNGNVWVSGGGQIFTEAGSNLTILGGLSGGDNGQTAVVGDGVAGDGTITLTAGTHGFTTEALGASANPDMLVNSLITGAGGPQMNGNGILRFAADNTYAGVTLVTNGTLEVEGSQSGSDVTVQPLGGATTATLGGRGTTGSVVGTGGTISPGDSPGALTMNNLALDPASSYRAELNGTTAGTQYDQVITTGTVALGSASLVVTAGFTPATGTTFTILRNTAGAPITGTFSGLPEGATVTVGGVRFSITYVGGAGHDVVLTTLAPLPSPTPTASPTSVPVPTTGVSRPLPGGGDPTGWVVLLVGLALITAATARARRRRRDAERIWDGL